MHFGKNHISFVNRATTGFPCKEHSYQNWPTERQLQQENKKKLYHTHKNLTRTSRGRPLPRIFQGGGGGWYIRVAELMGHAHKILQFEN